MKVLDALQWVAWRLGLAPYPLAWIARDVVRQAERGAFARLDETDDEYRKRIREQIGGAR